MPERCHASAGSAHRTAYTGRYKTLQSTRRRMPMPERTTQNAQTLLSPRVPRDTEHERYHPELEEELKECLFCLKPVSYTHLRDALCPGCGRPHPVYGRRRGGGGRPCKAADRPPAGTAHPVSYTHLDVYKRQILQGLNAPINDLSRGCNADEVYKMSLITACQS